MADAIIAYQGIANSVEYRSLDKAVGNTAKSIPRYTAKPISAQEPLRTPGAVENVNTGAGRRKNHKHLFLRSQIRH